MSIKKNFMYNFAYQILIMILPLLTTPYIARVIGPQGTGIQSYTQSIANYFVLFSLLGINSYGNRSIAMVRDDRKELNKTFTSIYLLQLIMSLTMIILYFFYIKFCVKDNKIIFIIQSIYIVSALLDINWFFFGMEQFKLTVLRNTIIKLVSVLSIFILVKNENDLYIYSLILAIGSLIGQMILWKYFKEYATMVKIDKNDIFIHFKPILILFIPVIAVSIYKIMDKIMLGYMSTMIQVGFYENSEKIINIPMSITAALGTVMLPKMSNLYANGNENDGKKYIGLSLDFVVFISIGAIFGLIGVSKTLIPIFLGEDFLECINIVSLISITIVFIGWANVIRTQYLIPKKMDKIYVISTLLGAGVNLMMNLAFIPSFGAVGAAIGTIFAEITVALYQTLMVRKELDIIKYFMRNIFYIIPGMIMCLLISKIGEFLGNSIISGIVQIIIGLLIYGLIGVIYMIYTKNDIITSVILTIKKRFFNK